MATSEFLAIHSTEKIKLAKPLVVVELHVNLGRPGPTVDVGDHELEYSKLVLNGKGTFTLLRHGKQIWKVEQ